MKSTDTPDYEPDRSRDRNEDHDHGKDKELRILQEIARRSGSREPAPQRDLAEVLGISLGMTNAILKRLAGRGWIVVKRVNNRKIMYLLTPDGAHELATRSYRYFKKTIRNVVFYKDRIDALVRQARKDGSDRVVLVGKSDLDFIVEHACLISGLELIRIRQSGRDSFRPGSRDFLLFGEGIPRDDLEIPAVPGRSATAHLWDVVRT